MRKIIAVLLTTLLLASMVMPANASSYNDFLGIDESEYNMNAYYTDLWDNYNHNMHGLLWDYVCGEYYYVYTQAVKEVGSDAWLEFASRLTDEELTQERYAEILVNLLAMMDYNMSQLIEDQVAIDTTKTLCDYAIDATGIIVQGISLNTAFGSKITEPMKKVTTALNLTWGGTEFTINTIETFEHLDRLLQQYNNYNLFLTAIVENATNRELQAAANELMSVVDKTFFCKVDATTKVAGDLAGYLGKTVFFDTVVLDYMVNDPSILGLSKTDMSTIELFKSAYAYLGTLPLAADLGTFAADMLIGISNVMNRYNEMRALVEIRSAVIKQMTELRADISDAKELKEIDQLCRLMKNLIYINYRGEYCAHEMLTNDAQAYSLVIKMNGQVQTIDRIFETTKEYTRTFIECLALFIFPMEELYKNTTDSNIESNPTVKQLTKIVRYDKYSGASGYSYELSYNDKNQLIGLMQGQASSETKHDPTFTYSPDGKLLWIITGEPTAAYAPGYNSGCGYEYNSSGQLIKEFAWEGGYGDTKYKYDSDGKCVGSVETGDFYTTTETHFYGADGTRLYSEVDTTFSDGSAEQHVVEYDYSYKPFVLERQSNTAWISLLLYIDDNISVLHLSMEDAQLYVDAEGYLEKAVANGATYYFYYDDSDEKNVSSFASVVEQCIEKSGYNSLPEEQQQICRGLLYDLNDDGQDELILQYLNNFGYALEVWSNVGGNVACVCSAITDTGLSYQNLGVGVGLGAYNGERYLVWFWEYADEIQSNNTNFIKEKELIYKITNGIYAYNDVLETSELEHISDVIEVGYPYYRGGMSLSELLAYLKNEDVAASPNAELKDAVCHNGHYYKVYNGQSSWEDAAAFCKSVGGHLATITSAEENTFLYDYLVSLGLNGAYFGFSDVNIEGEWAWCTGEEIAFTNWDSGEPNNEGRKEHYGLFDFSHNNGKWNDGSYRSASDAFFICEWDTLLQ